MRSASNRASGYGAPGLRRHRPSASSSPTEDSRGVGKWRASSAAGNVRARDFLRALDHVRIGDLLGADARLDFSAIFRRQRSKLLQKIAAKIPRMRDGGFVDAQMLQLAEGAHRGRAPGLLLPVDQAQNGIIELRARLPGWRGAGVEVAVERPRERRGGSRIKFFEPVDGGGGGGML